MRYFFDPSALASALAFITKTLDIRGTPVAAFLHDAIDDQRIPAAVIAAEFGADVAAIAQTLAAQWLVSMPYAKGVSLGCLEPAVLPSQGSCLAGNLAAVPTNGRNSRRVPRCGIVWVMGAGSDPARPLQD